MNPHASRLLFAHLASAAHRGPRALRATGLAWLACAALLVFGPSLASLQVAQAQQRTIVSLTFDDGLNQSPVRGLLNKYGLKGTFYINANMVGTGGDYLSKAELDALYADGHEIGGHTTNHVDLATLSDAAQRTAICGDMQTLNTWYPGKIRSFAYPFASTGPTTQGIAAAECAGVGTYSSARTVGGLLSGANCTGCPTAESIPPANPYYINTPESIMATDTLTSIQKLVTQAETAGGWVPLVFHNVCDGCSSYGVSPAVLDAFLAWLKARESSYTSVRTVHQVMSGDLPAPPPPPPMGANLLRNPSLETDANADGIADCWQRNTWGTNTPSWTRTSDAHTGALAERLQLTAYSSGDAKLLSALDAGQAAGGCAPNIEAGASYEFAAWYKATTSVIPVLYYRNAAGSWVYWRDGPQQTASTTWRQMTHLPGALPTGANAVGFGLVLGSVGTVTTDDYSLRKVLTGTADTTAPTVAVTSPTSGTAVSGTFTLTASASDNVGVAGVQFRLNGTALGAEDTAAPYAISWNTTTSANGSYTLTAVARDIAGNTTTSAPVPVTVSNAVADGTPPTVAMSAPTSGATVSGTATVSAGASDNVGVAGVQFRLNGAALGAEDTAAPYAVSWNTTTSTNGSYTLAAVARDAAGNTTTSAGTTVTVNNAASVGNVVNASLETDANGDGTPDCWQKTGFGTNTAIWSRVGGAHTGSFAQSLQITARSSGDRKLLQTLDTGTCASAVTPGTRYALSTWYKSTAIVNLVVYYRSSAGVWTYWASSPALAAATNWSQANFTTLAVPAGATHISFGLALSRVGTLVTDDYAMTVAP